MYFGPKAPKGKEANWIPTIKDRRFFYCSDSMGKKKELFDKSLVLNDVELVK